MSTRTSITIKKQTVAPATMELDTQTSDQQKTREPTAFAKRNPHLERLVPDAIENAVDALLPDRLEKVMIGVGTRC